MMRDSYVFPRLVAASLLVVGWLVGSGCSQKKDASPPGANGKPLTKVTLQTDWYAQPEHGGFYQAIVKGYYRDAGLDVTIEQGGPNALTVQRVATGAIEFSIGRSDQLMIAAAEGIPVVMVGGLMQRDPQAIMYHRETGIKEFKDLNGRSIMAVPGSGWITLLEKKYGIKISVTPLDFGLSRFLADKQFIQQCFITNEPFYVRKQGADPGALLLSETGFSPYRVWFTNRKFIQSNPDVVRAFTEASIRGWSDYMEGDRKAADAMIGSLNKQMIPEFIDFSVDAMKRYGLVAGDPAKGEAVGRLDPDRLSDQLRQLIELGLLTKPLKLEDVFDPRFLPAGLGATSP